MENDNGSLYILKQLKLLGITHIFMVPGKLINSFMSNYPKNNSTSLKDKLPQLIITACESGSAYMSEGYARATGNFGVCLVIGGPGVTNTLTGIASAFSDNYPILLLSGQIASQHEMRNSLQDSTQSGLNQRDIFKPITRSAYEVKNGQSIEKFLRESLRSMKGNEIGPVYLSLSQEALTSSSNYLDIYKSVLDSWNSEIIDLKKMKSECFKNIIMSSKNYIILAGLRGKSKECSTELVKFAEKYCIPVATTLSGKGAFPEDHPLSLGIYGYSGNSTAIEAFKDPCLDGIIFLGVDMTQWSTMVWSSDLTPRVGSIQVDSSIDYLGKYLNVSIGVCSSCNIFLQQLDLIYSTQLNEFLFQRKKWVDKLYKIEKYSKINFSDNNTLMSHPVSFINVIQKHFPNDGIVSVDSGSHRSFFGHYWIAKSPEAYLSATTIGPMGWSIPAAIGASFAYPNKKCMCITGDGCMLMQGMELATAFKYQCNVLFIVFNNSSYAASYFNNTQNLSTLADIPDYNWSAFSKSFGINSVSVNSHLKLEKILPSILDKKEPFLIEIKCNKEHRTPNFEYNKKIKEINLL